MKIIFGEKNKEFFGNNLLRTILFFCSEHGNMLHHLFQQFWDFRRFFQRDHQVEIIFVFFREYSYFKFGFRQCGGISKRRIMRGIDVKQNIKIFFNKIIDFIARRFIKPVDIFLCNIIEHQPRITIVRRFFQINPAQGAYFFYFVLQATGKVGDYQVIFFSRTSLGSLFFISAFQKYLRMDSNIRS